MENKYLNNEIAYKKAQKRVKEMKNYYWFVVVYIAVSFYLLYDNNYEHLFGFKQSITKYLLLAQGIVLVGYAIYLFHPFFQKWEEREIQKEIKKNSYK